MEQYIYIYILLHLLISTRSLSLFSSDIREMQEEEEKNVE